MPDTPLIHLMKTPYGYYFYDVNREKIIKTEQDVYEVLQNQTPEQEWTEATRAKVALLKSEGDLSSKRPSKIEHANTKELPYLLEDCIRMLTLQITQQCNFDCAYCIYSETGNSRQRTHSNQKMSFETAKKGIDFLLQHSREQSEISLGFYGGEPLLEFDFIKNCVAYANERSEGRKMGYNITTNGSLLTDDVIEFFIQNDFNVLISLDGPREIHDKSRVFRGSGKGTFDVIMKNLERVRAHYPEFFSRILFSAVVDPTNDYECVNSLYQDYEIFQEASMRSSLLDETYSDDVVQSTDAFFAQNSFERFKVYLHFLGRLERQDVSRINLQDGAELQKFSKRLLEGERELPNTTSPGGPCTPGCTRLFMDVSGNLFPCERVSELSPIMRIGHVDTGIDIERARVLLNVGQISAEQCKNCWAIRNCSLCCKYCDGGDHLSATVRKKHCDSVRGNRDAIMRDYIALQEVKNRFYSQLAR